MANQKVMIVTNILNPSRVMLFNELHHELLEQGVRLLVVFGDKTYKRRKFKLDEDQCQFDYKILRSKKLFLGNDEKALFLYNGLNQLIRTYQPQKIITAGFSFATLKLWWRSLFKPTPYMIWTGSILTNKRNTSTLRLWLRKQMSKRAKGFIVYGTKASEYVQYLGVPKEKINISFNTVDTTFFKEQTAIERLKVKSNGKHHLTYLGYLVPRKDIIKVLMAVQQLSDKRKDFVLDIVGDGPAKLALEEYVNQHHLNNMVQFHGFVQKEEVPKYLSKSSCFLFQTDFDVWGLVLNEAMAAGLPCIASPNAAASHDLIIPEETGFIENFDHTENIVKKIEWIIDHPIEANNIGTKAAQFIEEKASIQKSACNFATAILKVSPS